MALNREIKDFKKEIEKLEVEIIDIIRTARHYKFILRHNGEERCFFKSGTPSDGRGNLNLLSDIKKWMKSCNKINELPTT
jgi:hypothetical protein